MTNIKIWTFLRLNLLDFYCIFSSVVEDIWGKRWRSELRHCPTCRKAAGPIPSDVDDLNLLAVQWSWGRINL